MKGLEMVKCESLRINMFRITHTGKSVNFPVTPVVYITTLIFTMVMFCNQIINSTKNLIHLTELFRHGLMLLWFTD